AWFRRGWGRACQETLHSTQRLSSGCGRDRGDRRPAGAVRPRHRGSGAPRGRRQWLGEIRALAALCIHQLGASYATIAHVTGLSRARAPQLVEAERRLKAGRAV
ncbi:MAG TPA: hypothetical protein VKY90_05080, partial [Candidatus Dormibacteraeota bacterium]|nr:hypothetical protein [Candidatus Dormibacteraeota bacterium]